MKRAVVFFGCERCPRSVRALQVVRWLLDYYKEHGVEVPLHYVDAQNRPELNHRWGVRSLPTAFVIDTRNGVRVLHKMEVSVPWREIHEALFSR